MMNTYKKAKLGHWASSFLLAVSVFASMQASASTVTISGASFSVSYDSANLGLFGTPTIVGNDIVFSPSAFSTSTSGIDVGNFLNSTGIFDVYSNPGSTISALSISESGSYTLSGTGGYAEVDGELQAIDLSTANQTAPLFSSYLDTTDGISHSWTAGTGIDLSTSSLAGTQGVRLTVQNNLIVYAMDGSASLDKSSVTIHVDTAVVPIGDPFTLLITGMGLLGLAARRKS
jgi:hypothetical protein